MQLKKISRVLPPRDKFVSRHIGPRSKDIEEMLRVLGLQSLEELTRKAIPEDILLNRDLMLDKPKSELEMGFRIEDIAKKNQLFRSYIGMGYSNCIVPSVIQQNVLENPGWITQYTPYQAEVGQGRLECLMNYQTMIAELTGLPVANASLLDEATAAAEAMGLCWRHHKNPEDKVFYVDKFCHPQNIEVVKTRAKFFGVPVEQVDLQSFAFPPGKVLGVLLQYPDTEGRVEDMRGVVEKTHAAGGLVAVATDLLALCVLEPPGEVGADICLGNSQRFGVPLGYGGPHAGFFSVKSELLKQLPGRLVGRTKDAHGRPMYRLALQPREQHIKKQKANSNKIGRAHV